MSEEITNNDVQDSSSLEDIVPATLEDGEPVITPSFAEKYNEFVKNIEEVSETKEADEEETKNVISSGSQNTGKTPRDVAGITSVSNGVIGTGKVKQKPKNVEKQKEAPVVEKVAIFSTKNVTWSGVGKVYRGYNIVTKEEADKWLTRSHIRTATPEEVAREFNR